MSSAKRDHELQALLHGDMTLTSDDLLVTQSVENPTRQDWIDKYYEAKKVSVICLKQSPVVYLY